MLILVICICFGNYFITLSFLFTETNFENFIGSAKNIYQFSDIQNILIREKKEASGPLSWE
jgi:hypothetical protein